MQNVFDPTVAEGLLLRIRALTPESRPLWGKMDVTRMMAHCCVPYELAFGEGNHRRPGAVKRFLLRLLVKRGVVNETPYRRGLPTAPEFRIGDGREFSAEQDRLAGYVVRTAELGEGQFEGRDYPNFGPLTAGEWNNLLHKHLDHHLRQFGV